MGFEGLYRIVCPGEFGFREGLVDRAVTDLVQADRRPFRAAFQLRDEVVDALPRMGRDRPPAQRADQVRVRLLSSILFSVLSGVRRHYGHGPGGRRMPSNMTRPQPMRSVTPPSGVTAPSQRGAPIAIEYKVPAKIAVPITNAQPGAAAPDPP